MVIIIFCETFSFPEGNAATNRVHTYAKGFTENDITVHIISLANNYISYGDGVTNGIYFYHPFGQKKRNKYFIIRRWQKFVKYLNTIRLVKEINKKESIIAFSCWTLQLYTQFFVFILSKYVKSKMILERNEHPLSHYQGSFFRHVKGIIKLHFEIKFCDGIFCISRYLVDFYKNKGINPQKLLLVPSTVDPSRFIQNGENPFTFPYIGYFGGLTFKRDNIGLLINAFAKISGNHPEIHLVLGGFCSEKEKKQIENLIMELKILSKVDLLNYLTRLDIIKYIVHADILVMVRGNDLKSKASFPSKLTEYLATSKPVITVDVGEIKDYLTDGLNSFIVEPEDSDGLAKKIDYVLSNYAIALQVGQRGKELTNSIFNYNFQAKRMIDFIATLHKVGQ